MKKLLDERARAGAAHTDDAPPDGKPERLLSPKEVLRRIDLSRSTLWRLERAGEFPRRRVLSRNRVGYSEAEIAAWIRARKTR
jgi:predicted DNA-binding transcriptional regulator AlpA